MAHHNTICSQLLSWIPGHVFQKLERKHSRGRTPRKFGFKQHFFVMAFIHLAARRSLRDGVRSLTAIGKRLYHFGLKSVARSTVADANASRPVEYFKDLFAEMYSRCRPVAPKHKFRFKAKLYSMDATIVRLCLTLFPWAKYRSRTGGVKIHTVLDHQGEIPAFVAITEAKKHDFTAARLFSLPKGSIVTFDRGYSCYSWFAELCASGIFFVTRLKRNAQYKLIKRNSVRRKTGVTSDHVVEVRVGNDTLRLRRIGYRDEETGKRYEFLTNHFELAAKTIALVYKDRWQIELFFKELKQNLRIKHFVGNSENSVMIQIYTALTVYLLLAYQKFCSRLGISVQQLFELIQLNLLSMLPLEELLNPPPKRQEYSYKFSMLNLIS